MGINLTKGQNIDLTKGTGLTKIQVGLGWTGKKGFFSGRKDVDLDASIFMVDENNKLVETVYYGNKNSNDSSIRHHGDDLVGGGEVGSPNEIIDVDLSKVSDRTTKLVVAVNIYSGSDNFSQLDDAFVVINDGSNLSTELARYALNDGELGSGNACYIGEVYRRNGEWKFKALGEVSSEGQLSSMKRRFA
jgi:tellurium resistance protein TerD